MEALSNSFRSPRASYHEGNNAVFSLEEIEERIQLLLKENNDLRNTLLQNNTYMRQLSVTLVEWQEVVARVQNTYKNKFDKARELVLKLKEENVALRQTIALDGQATGTNFASPTNLTEIRSLGPPEHVQEGTGSLESFVLVPNSYSEAAKELENASILPITDSLSQNLGNLLIDRSKDESLTHELQREVDSLRKQLSAEMEMNKHKQYQLNETQSQLDRLMVDFEDLSKNWAEQSQMMIRESPPTDDSEIKDVRKLNSHLTQHCRELETQLASASQRLDVAEKMVLSKQADNTELHSEIARLEKSLETMDILKTQVELYQSDFEAEREARQNLAGEKEVLVQEVRLLKRQLEVAGRDAPEASNSPARRTPPEDDVVIESYECPKCNFKYSSNDSLNNHLDVCLTQQMFPE